MDHPISQDSLERFLEGRASREENRAIVAHLLQGCPSCSRKLQALVPSEVAEGAYDAMLDRLERALTASLDIPVTVERPPAGRSGRPRRRMPPRSPRRGPPSWLADLV